MSFRSFVKAVLPVMVGIFLAGIIMDAMRDNNIVNRAISGFDA
jgi:hypothetical protein